MIRVQEEKAAAIMHAENRTKRSLLVFTISVLFYAPGFFLGVDRSGKIFDLFFNHLHIVALP